MAGFKSDPNQAAVTERLAALAHEGLASRTPYVQDGSRHDTVFCHHRRPPTADVAWDRRFPELHEEHPIEEHTTVCPGAVEKTRAFRESFDPGVLSFEPECYRQTTLGSRAFHTRLIELVAVSLHSIGALLFQLDLNLHQGNVRSWAENRILGGVAVFDRPAELRSPAAPPNISFHSCRRRITYRYYQLCDGQQDTLIRFLLADSPNPSANFPLPILCDKQNTVRVGEERAINRGLFRDAWERRPPNREYLEYLARAPRNTLD
ncbi:hypothetical protein C8A05DRAFT_46204 [Staphylotrichum tortipilum]|uniref:Uncharacterized protein n=1 Tax=Staphylotrichum tortipilum TaxID=2831512 RepID=A0AAN6RR21_9PEZI|nr:hypothetical protein C8A05DRAFT_46204 [Staphylotrichum longicolle]